VSEREDFDIEFMGGSLKEREKGRSRLRIDMLS
jgi:hypothetical protein